MADIPDNNNAPDPSQVAPQNPIAQPNLPPQNPGMPSLAPQATAGTSPSGAPNTPAAQGASPNAGTPAAPMTPNQQHASVFHNVLSMLAGGGSRPVMGPNGQPVTDANGQVQMAPASTKRLGMGILAGAISGMMAGMATPRQFTQLPGGRMIEDNSGAIAAGAQASQKFTQQGAQTEAQKTADINTARQYQNMKANLDMHVLMMGVHRGDREDMEQTRDDYADTLRGIEDEQNSGELKDDKGNPMQLLMDGDFSNEQVLDMLKKGTISSVKNQAIPSNVINAPNDPSDPSKGTHPVMMYRILTNAGVGKVGLTQDMKDELPSRFASVPVGTPINVSLLTQEAHTRALSNAAANTTADWQEEYDKQNPDAKLTDGFSYKAWSAANPGDAKAINQILVAHKGQPVDVALDQIRKNPDFAKTPQVATAIAKLQQAMGIKVDALTAMANARAEALAQGKKGPDQAPADATAVANFQKNSQTRYPSVTAGQIASVREGLGKNPTVKDLKDAENEIQKMSEQNHQARIADEGISEKQQKQLLDYGQAGKLRLNLDNASDEMLVDQRTGMPIPNKSLTALKASQTEVNRAQFATSVLHLADSLRKAQAAGTLPNGPVLGLTKEALGKAGLNDADAAKALTEISLLQSAATGAHVGGRFSVPVLDKMAGLLKLNMNDSQFLGSLDAITDTMQTYKDNGGRFSVAEWKALPQSERNRLMGQNIQNQGGNQNQGNKGGTQGGFNPNALPKAN